MFNNRNNRIFVKILVTIILLIGTLLFYHSLPDPLFDESYSTVIEDSSGVLLSAKISEDQQWRFPEIKKIPYKFMVCLLEFEDRNFFIHRGVDVMALIRAAYKNMIKGKIVSGGSTISMQLIRIACKNKSRNIVTKLKEIFLALRLEFSYNKFEILKMYMSHAPFGGNVVGLDAASWRYFGRSSDKLSWAEAATLAVLPNNPAMIHPGKNRSKLLQKRNMLLKRLYDRKYIDSTTYELSLLEPLPDKPVALPRKATHLLQRVIKDGYKGKRIITTINGDLQEKINNLMNYYSDIYKGNRYRNMAIIVVEVNTGKVLAYCGNYIKEKPEDGSEIDMIMAARSTGSLLKPLLYGALISEGKITPKTLLPDIPIIVKGYKPENYSKTYEGAVRADMAVARSLNIPSVNMLKMYGNEKFIYFLRKLGISTLKKSPDYYGLSVILGGAEGRLWELVGIYSMLARILNNYLKYNGKYSSTDIRMPNYIKDKTDIKFIADVEYFYLNAGALYRMFEAMAEVTRPGEEISWHQFKEGSRISWKTGTSYGNKDAWAIGTNAVHTVGVWVGNANGEGRPGLTGLQAAAPVLFDVFKILKSNKWFLPPYDDMIKIGICSKSGYKATNLCEKVDTIWVSKNTLNNLDICKWHVEIFLDKNEKFRVNSDCEQVSNMIKRSWFVLPPVMEWYYSQTNPSYMPLPPLRNDCKDYETQSIEVIYPFDNAKIYLPTDIDGRTTNVVFQATHRKRDTKIFWHLDNNYIGTTINFHQLPYCPSTGKHTLVLVDENGESISVNFEILPKKKNKSSYKKM